MSDWRERWPELYAGSGGPQGQFARTAPLVMALRVYADVLEQWETGGLVPGWFRDPYREEEAPRESLEARVAALEKTMGRVTFLVDPNWIDPLKRQQAKGEPLTQEQVEAALGFRSVANCPVCAEGAGFRTPRDAPKGARQVTGRDGATLTESGLGFRPGEGCPP